MEPTPNVPPKPTSAITLTEEARIKRQATHRQQEWTRVHYMAQEVALLAKTAAIAAAEQVANPDPCSEAQRGAWLAERDAGQECQDLLGAARLIARVANGERT